MASELAQHKPSQLTDLPVYNYPSLVATPQFTNNIRQNSHFKCT